MKWGVRRRIVHGDGHRRWRRGRTMSGCGQAGNRRRKRTRLGSGRRQRRAVLGSESTRTGLWCGKRTRRGWIIFASRKWRTRWVRRRRRRRTRFFHGGGAWRMKNRRATLFHRDRTCWVRRRQTAMLRSVYHSKLKRRSCWYRWHGTTCGRTMQYPITVPLLIGLFYRLLCQVRQRSACCSWFVHKTWVTTCIKIVQFCPPSGLFWLSMEREKTCQYNTLDSHSMYQWQHIREDTR